MLRDKVSISPSLSTVAKAGNAVAVSSTKVCIPRLGVNAKIYARCAVNQLSKLSASIRTRRPKRTDRGPLPDAMSRSIVGILTPRRLRACSRLRTVILSSLD